MLCPASVHGLLSLLPFSLSFFLNVGAGSPGFLLTTINLNKPVQPHSRHQYKPDFINVKSW
ncbi:MAG TPA: hypothetical protein DEF27_07145 [Oscillatoriales bacterium UBA8482]|nr:hypothetical protein [Oscillatoriales bacterium UBA8482]